MSDQKSSFELALNSIGALNDFRHKMQNTFLKQIKVLVSSNEATPQVIKKGVDLLSILSNRQVSLEKELFEQFKNFLLAEGRDKEANDLANAASFQAPPPPSTNHFSQYHKIQIPINSGIFKFPVNLNNHENQERLVKLDAMPLQEVGGSAILIDQLKIEPSQILLAANSSDKVEVLFIVSPEMSLGKSYSSEIFIGGANAKIIPFLFTMIAEKKEDLTVSVDKMTT